MLRLEKWFSDQILVFTYQKNIRQVSIKKAKNTTNKIANAKYTSIFSKIVFVITYEPCFHEQVWFRNWQCLPCCYQLVINANVNLHFFFHEKTLAHCVWLKIWKNDFAPALQMHVSSSCVSRRNLFILKMASAYSKLVALIHFPTDHFIFIDFM